MSATSSGRAPRPDDPRVLRSRAAVLEAARGLFLRQGYAGTTMEEIAAAAGVSRRTLYNNYAGKDALFTEIVDDVTDFAGAFADGVRQEFEAAAITADSLAPALHDLAQRLALGILRPEVVALRRLLVREAPEFPTLAARYFDRAPGQVLAALAVGFARLDRDGLLRVAEPETAAAQFAYLAVGEPLDRAMLVGDMPTRDHAVAVARAGVETFLARYGRPLSGR